MYYVFYIIFLCVLLINKSESKTSGLDQVDQACVNSYKNNLNNSFLIGTWYTVLNFASRLNLPSSNYCEKTIIKNAINSDIQRYLEGYKLENPFNITDNPVISESFIYKGMIVGNTEAKFFIFDPKNYFYREDHYITKVFRRVSDDYMLVHECRLRGQFKSLLSRRRNVTDEELSAVTEMMKKDVQNIMETQKFCREDHVYF